jgi:hypothetical protein
MTHHLVKCPECSLQVEIMPIGSVLGGPSGQFIALCKHQNEDNGGYRCRVLQQAIDLARNSR